LKQQWAESHLKTLDENLEKYAWDGEWYLRAYRADGLKFGSKENKEASIFFGTAAMGCHQWPYSSQKSDQKNTGCCKQTFINRLRTYDL